MSSPASSAKHPLAKRWAAFAARTRVLVSLVLALVACALASPSLASLAFGAAFAAAGLAVRAWAAGHLLKNERLATSGPYAHVRNPLYVGSLIAGMGLGIASAQGPVLAVIVAVYVLWFRPVISEEEAHLRKIVPGFLRYEERVPRLVPSLRPRVKGRGGFSWMTYRRNREHQAALAFGACFAALCLKLAWP